MNVKKLSAYRIIDQKKRGLPLSKQELTWFLTGAVEGSIPKYQVTAFLMACYFQPMNIEETKVLTQVMINSGAHLKFKGKHFVDKHSTGGIGDKASFILAPIAACCGIKVPMIAGRGLGHTGGTIDKIECLKGFKTSLSLNQFSSYLEKNDFVLMGQTKEIAPADGLLYSLRDVTATVDSIPLITASILSKKLAEGANGIVMDIKTGNGAFMKSMPEATKLAKYIKSVLTSMKKSSATLITDMSQPLGNCVGNTLEIIESVETLQGQGPKDLTKLSVELAAHMIHIGGKSKDIKAARVKAKEALDSGKAYEKFRTVLKHQGANLKKLDSLSKIVAKETIEVKANKDGYLSSMENKEIGLQLIELGGGRKVTGEKIDHATGFKFHKKIGDKVKKGESLLTIYHHKKQSKMMTQMKKKFINDILTVSTKKITAPKLIKKIIV